MGREFGVSIYAMCYHAIMSDEFRNRVFYADARRMAELPDNSVHLVVTSPPYFNIKDYALDGYQTTRAAQKLNGQIGDIADYEKYIAEMLLVWKECERVLKPNGKLAVNAPLMPIVKKVMNTHYNRHIFDINGDIRHSIINGTNLFLLDLYIWNRTNSSKKLMFGSYPYPRNFYAQNTTEFVTVFVKDGRPEDARPPKAKEESKLTEAEWIEFTKQIWDIPIPTKSDLAFGKHSAIMPEQIAYRCIRLFTFVGDVVLDPFAGSGTTLKVAKKLNRDYVGYEISDHYAGLIEAKLNAHETVPLFE